eukprot:scaffold5233_cov145-Skeletonema_marinoi.AAC.11
MAIKLFSSRRKASSNSSVKQDDSSQYSTSHIKQVASTKNREAEPVLLYKEQRAEIYSEESNPEETRDVHPMTRLFDDASSLISGALSGAASMAEDVQSIITADVDDESVLGEERSVAQYRPEPIQVYGGPNDLARLIKDLGQQGKKMEMIRQEYVKAGKDVKYTRMRIKALSEKINLEGVIIDEKSTVNDQEDDNKSVGSVGGQIVRLGCRIENAATKAIFPHDHDNKKSLSIGYEIVRSCSRIEDAATKAIFPCG